MLREHVQVRIEKFHHGRSSDRTFFARSNSFEVWFFRKVCAKGRFLAG